MKLLFIIRLRSSDEFTKQMLPDLNFKFSLQVIPLLQNWSGSHHGVLGNAWGASEVFSMMGGEGGSGC